MTQREIGVVIGIVWAHREDTLTSMSGWSISHATTNSARGSSSSASSFNAYSARLRENPISTSCWINGGVGSGGGVGLRVRAFFFCRCLDFEGFLEVDWGRSFSCSGPWPFSGMAGVGGSAGRLASLARNWQAARAAAWLHRNRAQNLT